MRALWLAAVLLVGGCTATATTTPRPMGAQATRQVTGRVAGYTTAARGEMDGVILDDGTRVHFPPDLGATVLPLIQRGQAVRVVGFMTEKPSGKLIEATTITNVGNGATVSIAPVPPPEAPPLAPPGTVAPPGRALPEPPVLTAAQLTTGEGRVADYTTGPAGEMDGLVLENGTRVHFPSYAGAAILPLVSRGNTVRVIGWNVAGPAGAMIEVSKIIDTASGKSIDVAVMPAPAPPAQRAVPQGAVAPPGRPPLEPTPAPTRVR